MVNKKNFMVLCLYVFNHVSIVEAMENQEYDKIYDHQFDYRIPTCALATWILYISYNYAAQENSQVSLQYPVADAWYQAVKEKYPEIGLENKQFLVMPKSGIIPYLYDYFIENPYIFMEHTYIYFSQDALDEITHLYQKVIDGYPLHENEALALRQQEFLLLHKAGAINQKNGQTIMFSIAGLTAGISIIDRLINQGGLPPLIISLPEHKETNPTKEKSTTHEQTRLIDSDDDDTMSIESDFVKTEKSGKTVMLSANYLTKEISIILFFGTLFALLRDQEHKANAYACKHAEIETLKSALSLKKEDLLDELEDQVSGPFIPAQTSWGKSIQTIIMPIKNITQKLLSTCNTIIKSHQLLQFISDCIQNPLHPSFASREQLIKNEIDRRNQI